jgi:hypothetical protein
MTNPVKKEEKFRKHINTLYDWKKYCLEAVYPHCNGCEIPYLLPIDFDFWTIGVYQELLTMPYEQ